MHLEKDEDEHADFGKRKEQKGKDKVTSKCTAVKPDQRIKEKMRLFWVLILVVCGLP